LHFLYHSGTQTPTAHCKCPKAFVGGDADVGGDGDGSGSGDVVVVMEVVVVVVMG
jgi:hypothetical protein